MHFVQFLTFKTGVVQFYNFAVDIDDMLTWCVNLGSLAVRHSGIASSW